MRELERLLTGTDRLERIISDYRARELGDVVSANVMVAARIIAYRRR